MSATKIEFDPAAEKIVLDPKVEELPWNYFLGAGAVHARKIPIFGFRREHLPENVCLEDWAEDWAKNRRFNLCALATKRNLT